MLDHNRPVIVTGAGGFIGKAIIEALVKNGQEPIGLLHKSSIFKSRSGVEYHWLDLRLDTLFSLCHLKPKAVYHTAAVIPSSFFDEQLAKLNRSIDMKVLDFCSATGARLIYASSASVYRLETDLPENYYALQKKETEGLIRDLGVGCSLRISSPYGPNQRFRTVLKVFLDAALTNQPLYYFGSGSRTQDFVHVNDVARAFLAADKAGVSGEFDIASGNAISMKDLASLVVSLVPGCTSKILPAGKDDPEEGFRANYDLSRTIKELDWEPTDSLTDWILSEASK